MSQSKLNTAPAPRALEPDEDGLPLGAGIDFTDPRSALAPYYLQAGHVAAAIILGLVFVFFTSIPLWHTDVWGHLKFGQWIVDHRALPDHEPFCQLSDPQAPALDAYWLGQAGLYLIYHGGELLAGGNWKSRMEGGVEMLRTALALVVVLRCLILLLAFRRVGGSMPLACTALVLMLVLSMGHVTILRPQAFGELFFACLLLALSAPVLSRRAMFAVPVVMVLWANTHGSYLAGLVLLGLWLAGQMLALGIKTGSWDGRAAWEDDQARRLFTVLCVSIVAIAVANPHGPEIFWNTVVMGQNANVANMDEWLPLSFDRTVALSWIYVFSIMLLVGVQVWSSRWSSYSQLLTLGLFALQPWLHVRMMVWWFMLVPWIALSHWPSIRHNLDWAWLRYATASSFRKTIVAAMLMLVLISWSAPAQWLFTGEPKPLERGVFNGTPWKLAAQLKHEDVAQLLPQLAQYLDAHYPGGRFTGGIYATETLGDYLVWTLAPQTPVFIYTHVHLFTRDAWLECIQVKFARPGWRDVLDRHGVNLVLIEPELFPELGPLLANDPDWQIVLDETGNDARRDFRARHLIALRKKPI